MSIEVVTSEIKKSGRNLKAAANGVNRNNPSDDVGAIAKALPGSESAAAAQNLGTAWQTRFKGWYDDVVSESETLMTSADEYDAADLRGEMRARAQDRGYVRAPGGRVPM